MTDAPSAWEDAARAACLLAVDPAGLGGVALRALAGPVRDAWIDVLRSSLPRGATLRRVPLQVGDGRLLGGLDLAATLRAGRPIAERGILAEADGGVVLLAMAERLTPQAAGRLAAVLDLGEVNAVRDGVTLHSHARLGMVALDEGMAPDERPPAALLDRMAFLVDLGPVDPRDLDDVPYAPAKIAEARATLSTVTVDDAMLQALCAAGLALGVDSPRLSCLAVQAARVAAALAGRDAVAAEDATLAARLVLAPRATILPAPPQQEQEAEPPPEAADQPDAAPPPPADNPGEQETQTEGEGRLDDVVLDAAQAAIPAGLLAQLQAARAGLAQRVTTAGRAGALQKAGMRGRPAGVRRGEPRAGARLNVVETLRAAAPWQRLRNPDASVRPAPRVQVRREDFCVNRSKPRSETTTIFAVDASGSSALNRLAEAKGAVELLLAECYVRRDRVAVLAFRGRAAALLLPPTRSLVRAKRSLAGLPGGGGTPLACGIDAAVALADAVRRRGGTPSIVLLTDGQANVARDGTGGRARARQDAQAAARLVRGAGFRALLVDTAPKPLPATAALAAEMRAVYLPLPYADAAALSRAAQAASGARRAR